ncbi:hypothetical protein [Pseudoteredinibacter isoporae]|uniref:Uncharacterized protein n=1 Tax=Pseudoteredinibacter isoporae TaxID=570281 RepID=A0A7X0MW63_9GAMM|nr:hypothetical protein [Pseudoteredinibacter isoporae]MBB6522123.1 hypothetical protein [Pseudoteredinibacter isoporae]NHO87658.1 hypothetical protein [Pseudoteredinibacter isoporae]NIB24011.1 hypothetical protein [Pseudoteredinibacter isoporae]
MINNFKVFLWVTFVFGCLSFVLLTLGCNVISAIIASIGLMSSLERIYRWWGFAAAYWEKGIVAFCILGIWLLFVLLMFEAEIIGNAG